jgi:hypothetical protein
MTVLLSVFALIGLVIFIVGAVLHLLNKPNSVVVMLIGALIYAVIQVIVLFDVLF